MIRSSWRRFLAVACFGLGAGPRIVGAQTFTTVHSFSREGGDPESGLILASDGRYYGTAPNGGVYGLGSIYVLEPDGNGGFAWSNLYAFKTADPAGNHPMASLIQASDGNLYGTAAGGGSCQIFRSDLQGNVTELHVAPCADGPASRLLEAGDGHLYGTTPKFGVSSFGTLYRIDFAGNFNLVHVFTAAEGSPNSALTVGPDGLFYGTATGGTAPGAGAIVYRTDSAGNITVVHAFSGTDGYWPSGDLILASDGWLYGTTEGGGGSGNAGSIYRILPDGSFGQVYAFPSTGFHAPKGGVVEGPAGTFSGALSQPGTGWSTALYRFADGVATVLHELDSSECPSPVGALARTPDGTLLEACQGGGRAHNGIVFSLDPSDVLGIIHEFQSPDGFQPDGDLTIGPDGALYGIASEGGPEGVGALFRIDPTQGFSVRHGFTADEGMNNTIRLVSNGLHLFGTTVAGANFNGTFYRLEESGELTPLFQFAEANGVAPRELNLGPNGLFYGLNGEMVRLDASGAFSALDVLPHDDAVNAALVEGSDGFLYGTTQNGGAHFSGTVFRIGSDGGFEELAAFSGPDGSLPGFLLRLVQGVDGAFYGTTSDGGAQSGGTVFRFQPPSTLTSLYSFGGYLSNDGYGPEGAVALLDDGRACGVAPYGASFGGGIAYCVDSSGVENVLHVFGVNDDLAANPGGGLLRAPDGALYGTAANGGLYGGGVVFRIDVSSSPVVTRITPASGPASGGSSLEISGLRFHDGAAVSIGAAAAGDVVMGGDTEISATAPALAPGTLNDVVVTNPGAKIGSLANGWFADFLDLPQSDVFHPSVEKIFRDGITAGCGSGLYCRDAAVTRAAMAVLLLKSELGPAYVPRQASGTMFVDVPASAFAAAWIEDLASRGYAAGCGGGYFCPDAPVTRAQMAVLLLKTSQGSTYEPPPATGGVFEDVPADAFAAAWIESLAARGVTAGCGASPPLYCPSSSSTRGQMSVFLVKAFGLP